MFKRLLKVLAVGILVLLAVLIAFFVIWTQFDYKPSQEVENLGVSKQAIPKGGYLLFQPSDNSDIKGGYIIYQGAKVDAMAYGYYAQEVAKQGYLVGVVDAPFNVSFFSSNKVKEIMKEYPTIDNWFIGGHSLGGVVASSYAYNHQSRIQGLILLASYPMNKNDFSNTNYPILSLTGERDGLSTPNKISETKHLLSRNAKIVELKGANHAQFGLYGEQKGDNEATISPQEQQTQMVQHTVQWLNEQIK